MTNNKKKLAFTKKNYTLMLIGIGLLVLGFTVMSLDNQPHGFGVLGLTVGPIIVMAGFITEFFAIFAKSKDVKEQ